MNPLVVGVAGVTGAVGQEFLRVLEARDFPISRLVPLASARSLGKTVRFRGEDIPVEELRAESFAGMDLALFSAGASVSREMAPVAVRAGTLVVDNSSAFRYEPDIPLVVPEVNPAAMAHLAGRPGIIANPNCSTIILLMALGPIHREVPVRRVTVSTYQAASGAGAKGLDALDRECAGETLDASPFPHRLAGNLIPRIDSVGENGYTREEMKMVWETRKILGEPGLIVSATCVRVPVRRAHSESVQLTLSQPLSVARVREILEAAPGVRVVDDAPRDVYPTPLAVSEKDDVEVGRIRVHPDDPSVIEMWVVGDQILKGAALNAVQIAEAYYGS